MKKLLSLITLAILTVIWSPSTFSAEPAPICVTAVFFYINGTPPLDDLVLISVKATEISLLQDHRGRPLLAIYVIRGPVGSRNATVFSGHEVFGVSTVGSGDVYIGQFDGRPGQTRGLQFTLFEVGGQHNVTVPDDSAAFVVVNTDSRVLISLDYSSPYYPDAQARSVVLPFSLIDTCLL